MFSATVLIICSLRRQGLRLEHLEQDGGGYSR